jgi:hypothetical protein
VGAQVSYFLIIESRERICKAVRFSRNLLGDDDNVTSSGTQEGVAEWRICRTTKCVLVKACTGSGVVCINEDPIAALLASEELEGL